VIKYGSSSAAWTVGGGDGSLLAGGVGSVLLGTDPYALEPANSGTPILPADQPQAQTGLTSSSITTISDQVGRVIGIWSGGKLVGFESLLDITQLDALTTPTAVNLGDKFILDLQRGTVNFQDSLGVLPSSAASAVPEPTTVLAGAILLLPFIGGVFRSLVRKERKA
jgi:hypothetical protein